MSLTNNPKILKHIADRVVEGSTQQEIAEDYGVSQQAISKVIGLNKPYIKQLLQKAYDDLVQLSPHVVAFYKEEMTRETNDIDDRKLKASISKELTGLSGLSPVRDSTNNYFFANIVRNTQINLVPQVKQLLDRLIPLPLSPNSINTNSTDADSTDTNYIDEEIFEESK